jgi:hypothetical protein
MTSCAVLASSRTATCHTVVSVSWDGDKTIAKNRKEWKDDNNQNLPRIEGQRVSWASH